MIERMSFNQATFEPWTLEQCVHACEAQGVPYIAPWRHKLETLAESAALLRGSGLRLSSLCRGGWFSAPTREQRKLRLDDNRRAIDECAAIGSPLLVLVCGPADGQTLDEARQHTTDAIAELLPYAAQAGVALGIEPLHPMFAADRSVVVSLKQANDIVASLKHPSLGVVIDAYHVWWDPEVYAQIQRAAGSILGFHVSDWKTPLPDVLMGRSLMGEGVIELRRLREAVDATGYCGPIEVEIFNAEVRKNACEELLADIVSRYRAHVFALERPRNGA